jgi:sarcosine oxidase
LEQFDVSHNLGSSHGLTRIIRLAYNEHPDYVPLLLRAYEMWHRLESDADEQLLVTTGGLDIGPQDGRVFAGALESCQQHDLDHEVLSGIDIAHRYPGFQVPEHFNAVLQPDAGYLRPERCILSHVMQAMKLGATIRAREAVIAWEKKGDQFEVTTSRGSYRTPSLVITAGAWAGKVLDSLVEYARPQRQVVGWFQPDTPALYTPDNFPVFILDVPEGEYYGFPIDHQTPGFKLGRFYHLHQDMDPDGPRQNLDAEDEEVLRRALRRYFPDANGATMAMQSCVFTITPDRNFILDTVTDIPGLIIGAGFSGHGFKFATVIGEILADLAEAATTRHEIGLFAMDRFSKSDAV